jgi:hypothetical protein
MDNNLRHDYSVHELMILLSEKADAQILLMPRDSGQQLKTSFPGRNENEMGIIYKSVSERPDIGNPEDWRSFVYY